MDEAIASVDRFHEKGDYARALVTAVSLLDHGNQGAIRHLSTLGYHARPLDPRLRFHFVPQACSGASWKEMCKDKKAHDHNLAIEDNRIYCWEYQDERDARFGDWFAFDKTKPTSIRCGSDDARLIYVTTGKDSSSLQNRVLMMEHDARLHRGVLSRSSDDLGSTVRSLEILHGSIYALTNTGMVQLDKTLKVVCASPLSRAFEGLAVSQGYRIPDGPVEKPQFNLLSGNTVYSGPLKNN